MHAIDSELMRYKFASTPENYDVVDVSKRVLDKIKTKIDVVNREIWCKQKDTCLAQFKYFNRILVIIDNTKKYKMYIFS